MGAPNHCGSTEWLRGALKSPNNVASSFFNTIHLLPKDVECEPRGAKLASCPGRHLTLLHPCCTLSRASDKMVIDDVITCIFYLGLVAIKFSNQTGTESLF